MKKKALKMLVDQNKSALEIAEIIGKSKTTTYYWLNKFGLRINKKGRWADKIDDKSCEYCGEVVVNRNRFCNNTCYANYRAMLVGEEWKKNGAAALSKSGQQTGLITGFARRYIFIINNSKCSKCGWTYNFGDGSHPPLECAHIDGNHANNILSNIELLCPNCHAIETRLNPITKGAGRWSNGADSRNYAPV